MSDRLVAETDSYTVNKAVERPCPQWDSNPRSQQSIGRRIT